MDAKPPRRRRRWVIVVCAAAAGVAAPLGALLHATSPHHDDCAVAADVISTWRSMTASVDQMIVGPADQLLTAAVAESATADQLRSTAGGVASSRMRADLIGLADALDTIAGSHRAAFTSHDDSTAGPAPQYIKGCRDAAAAVAALRLACPSIPAGGTEPPAWA